MDQPSSGPKRGEQNRVLREMYEQDSEDAIDNYYEQEFAAVRAKFEEELDDGSFGPVQPPR